MNDDITNRTQQVTRWPNGARLAVYVIVAVEDYRPEDGLTEDIVPGVPAPDLVNRAWRDYGNNEGAQRLIDVACATGIPVTTMLNTMLYDSMPDVLEGFRTVGAEFVAHGHSNSDTLAGMSPDEELRYVGDVSELIEKYEGQRPRGWSSPWLTHTPTTTMSLAQAGYQYLLDLRSHDRPVWISTEQGPLLSIPYSTEINDSTSMIGRQVGAADFADMIIDEFDELLTTGGDGPLVMSVITHAFISGAPFRTRHLRRALEHIAAHADTDVWLTRPGEIFDAFRALSPAPDTHGSHP